MMDHCTWWTPSKFKYIDILYNIYLYVEKITLLYLLLYQNEFEFYYSPHTVEYAFFLNKRNIEKSKKVILFNYVLDLRKSTSFGF